MSHFIPFELFTQFSDEYCHYPSHTKSRAEKREIRPQSLTSNGRFMVSFDVLQNIK